MEVEIAHLRRENFMVRMENTNIKNDMSTMREVAPLDRTLEEAICPVCETSLGVWDYADDYHFCPYCGAYIARCEAVGEC